MLRLHCCSCGHRRPATAFQSKQARRRDDQRKCRACVDLYKSGPLPALRSETLEANKAKHRQHMAVRAAKTERAATEAAEAAGVAPATDADSADDPLRLARKAETVLRGRTDRVLLILENCSDDFNHVAVLRTCEALGVMRVWLVETADRPTKNTYVQPGTASDSSGPAAAAASLSAGATKAQRQLESRCVQRGFEYDRMLGLRRAQLFAAHLDVETFATSTECIAAARAAGRELWVTDLAQDALPLSSDAAALAVQLPPYVAVVLGAEAAGVTDEMLQAADRRIYLPMFGFTESFNLSVAAALVLQRLLDAVPESRGRLPAEEMDRLRRSWYSSLARSDAAREEFARLADLGGAVPFCDARRPEDFRDERRRVAKPPSAQ